MNEIEELLVFMLENEDVAIYSSAVESCHPLVDFEKWETKAREFLQSIRDGKKMIVDGEKLKQLLYILHTTITDDYNDPDKEVKLDIAYLQQKDGEKYSFTIDENTTDIEGMLDGSPKLKGDMKICAICRTPFLSTKGEDICPYCWDLYIETDGR